MDQQTDRIVLKAERRSALGKRVKKLREQGLVPGVMYGRGFEPSPLQFETGYLRQLLSRAGGSQLIELEIKGQDGPNVVLVRDVQRDVIRGDLLHIDLYRVVMTERIRTAVPLVMVGESPAIEQAQGILLAGISEIEVECLPGNLVDLLEIDISLLIEVGQALHVRDLTVPESVTILTDQEEMVVRVVPLGAEEELEAEAEAEILDADVSEVEVITETQREDESGSV